VSDVQGLIPESADAGTRISSVRRLESPMLREIHAHWDRLRGDRRWPLRSELNPGDIRRHLSHVFLIEVIDGGADFFHKLAGETVIQAHSYDIVHTHVSTADYGSEEKRRSVLDFYRSVVERGDPARLTGTLDFLNRDFISFETVYLPFSHEGRSVDVLFGASQFRSRHERSGR
jgi:hypothetical protein